MKNCPKCKRHSYCWDPVRREMRCLWHDCRYTPTKKTSDDRQSTADKVWAQAEPVFATEADEFDFEARLQTKAELQEQ